MRVSGQLHADRVFSHLIGDIRFVGQQYSSVAGGNTGDSLRQIGCAYQGIVHPGDPYTPTVSLQRNGPVAQNTNAILFEARGNQSGLTILIVVSEHSIGSLPWAQVTQQLGAGFSLRLDIVNRSPS